MLRAMEEAVGKKKKMNLRDSRNHFLTPTTTSSLYTSSSINATLFCCMLSCSQCDVSIQFHSHAVNFLKPLPTYFSTFFLYSFSLLH